MLTTEQMPYCPGCGHRIANQNIGKAIESLGIASLDAIVVSDIGCSGLIDALVDCHTIHGLHGRACALASGIALGLNDSLKKVIALQGDGGATIGLQHLLEAARRNVDMTLIVLNNMIYGMTGGQISGLSTAAFKAERMPAEGNVPHFDIVELAHKAGASYCTRITALSGYEGKISEAISTGGFSLVEILGLCSPYGLKKAAQLQDAGYEEITLRNERTPLEISWKKAPSLFDAIPEIDAKFHSGLEAQLRIVIAGSAGEGVQSAADVLVSAGVAAGLHATKKGDYPITVGTGFSIAEVILSKDEIGYSGIEIPGLVIITSEDGLQMMTRQFTEIPFLIIDSNLETPTSAKVISGDFRRLAGNKGAALCAIAHWIALEDAIPSAALLDAVKGLKHEDKMVQAIEKGSQLAIPSK